MSSHIKDKIIGKMQAITAKPIKAYYDRKVKRHSDQVDKDVAIIKDYRAMRDNGMTHTKANSKGATGFQRKSAEYEMVKNKYKG